MPGHLYIVSTPIGNLGDLSPRAVKTLAGVQLVLAEDTRHSAPMLEGVGVKTPLQSYHEHKEARATPAIVARLQAGEDIALISDAGTPLLSDPGARLVRAALDAGIPVVPIPGASALLAALVASGLGCDRFTFYGFLPRKGRERDELLREIVALRHTAVIYEAPNRVAATLAALDAAGAGERDSAVARELTKRFEEVRRGTVRELSRYHEGSPPRGEVVIVLAGAGPGATISEAEARHRARTLRDAGASAREVTRTLVEEHGLARNLAYRLTHEPE